MIWIQSGKVIDQLLSKPEKRLTWYLHFVNLLYIQKKTCATLIFHVLDMYWNFVKRRVCLPRVTSRKGISHENATECDEGEWVVLKTLIWRDVIIEQPLSLNKDS